ncbi:hypothetical protein K7X08_015449 [Anisodus acutangulus]|uniref:Uncharacterized protein n=1 Tax=Anisodus acutangulus TaxID=402998 RepID=A0A9Q1QUJ9_9SOLA|nr:hypothetical protein K7X08_015449 [Anisodus acutangulus]
MPSITLALAQLLLCRFWARGFISLERRKDATSTRLLPQEAPLQPGGTECGYCVMRFMKELMLDSTLMTNNFYVKHMYSQEELDDIRDEWGLHFLKILVETEVVWIFYEELSDGDDTNEM